MSMTLWLLIGLAVLLLGLISFIISRYVTVGSEEALIVTGSMLGSGENVCNLGEGRKIKVVSGGGTLVLPFVQQSQRMTLTTYTLTVKANEVYTKQKVRLGAISNAVVKVGSDLSMIATASENFMGKSHDAVSEEITSILDGHLRAILGSMTVEDAYSDREAFSRQVKNVAEPDLNKLGFEIRSFNVRDYIDVDKYLEYQSRHRIAEVQKEAEIAESIAKRESRIETAKNEQEAKRAELERDTQVAEASKENQLKMSEFKKEQDSAKAEADMAYDLQKARIAQQVKEQEMQIEIVERVKQIELQEKESERRQRQYQADINLKADSDAYALEKSAEAQKRKAQLEAEARQYEVTTQAKAHAEKVKLDGLAEASASEARGKAEAMVIREIGLAEANAQEEKAKAFEKYGEAAKLEMILNILPQYAEKVAAPLASVESIKIIDTGNGNGIQNMTGSVTGIMSTLQETLQETTGLNLVDVINNYSGKHNIKGEMNQIASAIAKDEENSPKDEVEQ
ncbi:MULTISPECIES: flotillin family protein [Bacillus]|uniref:flotillin family protein n=1 Tax=Bacillus TaxID=1386 RepID=UPI0002E860BC|nr:MULTISPECIES: SPFH domain-containing protein [Bacillus]